MSHDRRILRLPHRIYLVHRLKVKTMSIKYGQLARVSAINEIGVPLIGTSRPGEAPRLPKSQGRAWSKKSKLCKRGHLRTPENTIRRKDGTNPKCRTCYNLLQERVRRERGGKSMADYLAPFIAAKAKLPTRDEIRAEVRKRRAERVAEFRRNNIMWGNSTLKAKLRKLFHGAKTRGIEFNITVESFPTPLPTHCVVLGIELSYDGGDGSNNASIDRIDSTKGYVPGNVRIVSLRANTLKNNGTVEEHRLVYQDMLNTLEPDVKKIAYAETEDKKAKQEMCYDAVARAYNNKGCIDFREPRGLQLLPNYAA